jgi:hypothetical protein
LTDGTAGECQDFVNYFLRVVVDKSPDHSKPEFQAKEKRILAITPVAVEKLLRPKFAKIKLR